MIHSAHSLDIYIGKHYSLYLHSADYLSLSDCITGQTQLLPKTKKLSAANQNEQEKP